MKSFRVVALLTVALFISVSAHAQASRTWVSGVGDDANPCSRTAPCKTFAGAISKTATGGEISVLDPGGFGAVTITKSITINGVGTNASILATIGSAIIVNGSGVVVNLFHLQLNGAGTGGTGIRIINAAAVNVKYCEIYGFGVAGSSRGINVENGAGINVKVSVTDTKIFNSGQFGIASQPTSGGTVSLSLDHVNIFNTNGSALNVKNDTKATVSQCTFTNNAGAGVFAELTSADVNIYQSVLSNNLFGVVVGNGGNPVVRLYGSQITDNSTDGIHINSGNVLTHQNNAIQNNAGTQATTGNLSTQ